MEINKNNEYYGEGFPNPEERKKAEEWRKPDWGNKLPDNRECSLNKPLWMVIPPEGIMLPCPVHGEHFIPPSSFL